MYRMGAAIAGLGTWILLSILSARAGDQPKYGLKNYWREYSYSIGLSILILAVFRMMGIVPIDAIFYILPVSWGEAIGYYTQEQNDHYLMYYLFGVVVNPFITLGIKLIKKWKDH